MKNSVRLFITITFALAMAPGLPGLGYAQAPKAKSAPAAQAAPVAATAAPATAQAEAAPANPPAAPGWSARCSSVSRGAPLECAIEQTAVLTKTGQLIVLINIRVPADTHAPVAVIQLPLGLNLPAGAKLQVDDGKATDLQIQTCEQRGCYTNTPISPEMLAAMKTGKQLKVSFQNLAKEVIAIPMPLTDFAAAYDKIK
ncbi:Invasion protein IalB, involved in pathogenesis [Bradyrhizobium lablabi]|uniref:Invasion protein IalB, involved in pathogenesis n=3 Tax=Nitrobacteraceae TaxID=41294 RepID=A0ABY0PCW4_9BRAD|nr:Invasion protein IalB, involved in pathogenesis [Bradyrhizobium ottawaense]SEE24401.1 Invasion protein IalB, involved in pathogenesis [Bradyrhizobium lablabi]SHM20768.1 Invasion protein IalB, involved in pathogenesis [Bradyrhizobium lablabi]